MSTPAGLLSLPNELLLIIELSLPPDYACSHYKERRDGLQAYSPVCRRVHDIVQPILQSPLMISGKRPLPSFAEERFKRVVRLMAYGTRYATEAPQPNLTDVLQLVQRMPLLQDVRLSGLENSHRFQPNSEAALKDWEFHSEMRHLTLIGIASPPSFSFLHLQSLALHGDSPPVLPLDALPNLRALHTTSKFQDRQGQWHLYHLPHFHSQLDMLQFSSRDLKCLPSTLLANSLLPVLCTVDGPFRYLAETPALRHIHITPPPPSARLSVVLKDLTQILPKLPQLLTLSLSHHFRPVAVSFPAPEVIDDGDIVIEPPSYASKELQTLLDICAERSIEVQWRTGSFGLSDDKGVSREFWAYAKELRRKREEDAAASKIS